MKHSLVISVAVLALVGVGTPHAAALEVNYSLNLLFVDPQDDQSGGTWELVARADEEGLVLANVDLTGIQTPVFQTPQGLVGGTTAGFEVNEVIDFGTYTQLAMAQFPYDVNLPQFLFYDVGVLGGGTMPGDNGTPDFTFDAGTERNIPWGRLDTFGDAAWNGAVLLASGNFAPGTVPAFLNDGTTSSALVFTSVGDDVTFGEYAEAETVTAIVRMGIQGDYNSNGQVEQADLDLVLLNWGADGTTPPAGWINDLPFGQIDQEELDGVLLSWGNMLPGALVGAPGVPEPSTLALVLTVAAVFYASRRRVGW
jgi:hypothetical protein